MMKQFSLITSVIAFITMVTGTILRSGAAAMIGWALCVVFFACYLDCCDRDDKRRAERLAEELRKKHENDMDTMQFSKTLAKERLMREYKKIKL